MRESFTTAPTTAPLFSCRNLAIDFGDGATRRRVLDGVDFDVQPGEFLAILGTSGVGKTTLLRILGGLQKPADGSTVNFESHDIDGPPERVVMVFQEYASSLLNWRTVAGNVALPVEHLLDKQSLRVRIEEVLDLVSLAGRDGDYPWQLSGGMQQRVQLARALVMRPDVLLMDEPFGALDAMTRSSLQDELLSIQRKTGTTILFITHDIEEAIYLSDRLIVLSGSPGRLTLEREVDLPRPRDQVSTKEDPRYLRLRHEVHDAVGSAR